MKPLNHTLNAFFRGLVTGVLAAVIMGLFLIYALNMTQTVAISIVSVPDIHRVLGWAYDNLRLSIIPFGLVFVSYVYALLKLNHLLEIGDVSPVQINQSEQMADLAINVFFGIGVIWTAIGMRSALLEGLGGLDAASAARQGAFSILKRLVDGGILLSLSTSIVGGIGGYFMRLGKTLALGEKLSSYYNRMADSEAHAVKASLKEIERLLALLVHSNNYPFREISNDPSATPL